MSNIKHSVIRKLAVARLFSLLLMGAIIIVPGRCVPVKKENNKIEPWWCLPCKNEHKTRHSRGINDPLKNTFEIAITNYETQVLKYVKHLHTEIGNMAKKQIRRNTWLPRKKFFRSLRKDDEKILPELHYQIQIYAVTIQRLLNMEIKSQDGSFDAPHRLHILNIVKSNINLLRCETEQEIAEKQMKVTKSVPVNFVDKKIPAVVKNTTDGLLKDFTILKDYHNFIKKTYLKVFGRANKPRGKGSVQKTVTNPKNQRTPKNMLVKKVTKS